MNNSLYLISGLLLLVIIILAFLWFIRRQLQDDSITIAGNFQGEKVMFVFPHPDDEITCAGTLKKLNEESNETILLTLTKGEAGTTNGLVDESDPFQKKAALGRLRQQELEAVGQLLGLDRLEIFNFPDHGIEDIDPDLMKKLLKDKIEYYQPTILVTYDDRIGLYGHPDHIAIARYVKEIFLQGQEKSGFSVKQMYQVTLPQPTIATALKISASFRQNYALFANNTLPAPTMAVKISKFGKFKRDAMLLHRSQRPTFDEMQPYFALVPPFIYFRIFDKEYFTQVTK
ncbi:MAG: PIG-L family deacetylase [Cyanosarcina radialis HA8281-LM2]|jgi:LmbE family N-acetylglucosaminyl deacetylase|nr:PIG-L family deacetylase [Cyanosarcina radialis HA8281-LM2]